MNELLDLITIDEILKKNNKSLIVKFDYVDGIKVSSVTDETCIIAEREYAAYVGFIVDEILKTENQQLQTNGSIKKDIDGYVIRCKLDYLLEDNEEYSSFRTQIGYRLPTIVIPKEFKTNFKEGDVVLVHAWSAIQFRFNKWFKKRGKYERIW